MKDFKIMNFDEWPQTPHTSKEQPAAPTAGCSTNRDGMMEESILLKMILRELQEMRKALASMPCASHQERVGKLEEWKGTTNAAVKGLWVVVAGIVIAVVLSAMGVR